MKLFDVVRMRVDAPNAGLWRGMVGTIVFEHDSPDHAFEVDFSDEDGASLVMGTVSAGLLELVTAHNPINGQGDTKASEDG